LLLAGAALRPDATVPLGLGAGLLDVALKGAQLLMEAPPDLAHQPNLPMLSASVPWLSTVTIRSAAPIQRTPRRSPGPPAAGPRPRHGRTLPWVLTLHDPLHRRPFFVCARVEARLSLSDPAVNRRPGIALATLDPRTSAAERPTTALPVHGA
jgi:hypothetical protein